MAGEDTFQCQATGCWEPNALPKCIDEDLISSSWDPASSSSPSLWAVLVSVCGATALVSTLTAVCGVMACRKRRTLTQTPAPHWSTHVTVTPTLTTLNTHSANNNNNNNGAKPTQQQEGLVLPSYEEALREDVVGVGRRGLEQERYSQALLSVPSVVQSSVQSGNTFIQLSYAIKSHLMSKGTQSLLLGAFLVFRGFFMA